VYGHIIAASVSNQKFIELPLGIGACDTAAVESGTIRAQIV